MVCNGRGANKSLNHEGHEDHEEKQCNSSSAAKSCFSAFSFLAFFVSFVVRILSPTRSRRLLRLVAQLAPEDLADIRLGQVLAEIDIARAFVSGQMLAAVLHHIGSG